MMRPHGRLWPRHIYARSAQQAVALLVDLAAICHFQLLHRATLAMEPSGNLQQRRRLREVQGDLHDFDPLLCDGALER